MRIAKIVAKNFRTLEDATIAFGENYCTISGKNNAGKSCIIKLLSTLMHKENTPWGSDDEIDFNEDRTQWKSEDDAIEIAYHIMFNKNNDSSFAAFIERTADIELKNEEFLVSIDFSYKKNAINKSINIEDKIIDGARAKDILEKIKNSNLLFLHNSTNQNETYFSRNRRNALVEFVLSDQEKKQIIDAESQIQSKIKKFAKQHKDELQGLLGKLDEKHSVEFSTLNFNYSRLIPLGVRLIDKNVNVPLNDWGSGTQNKTYILLSILWANRIKTQGKEDERITPVVIIEEPESFLHPSAQAEFGKLLSALASELGIQIIVTTHSPYMLNRVNPSNNILIRRQEKQSKQCASEVVVSSGEAWMMPFSEHLGIPISEFKNWTPIFNAEKKKILLVEGVIDKAYFDFIREGALIPEQLPADIDIVPYGGKDALKNTVLLKFTLEKYDEAYITFDLDALTDVKKAIESIGYKEGQTYFAIGLDMPGHKDIEGLLPDRVRSKVFGSNAQLVTKAIGGDRESKDILKKLYLEEFKSNADYQPDELKKFSDLFKRLSKGIKANINSLRNQPYG